MRIHYFFKNSQSYAQAVHSEFNWQFREVPNSGHDPIKMLIDAFQILFP
jgi:hypothetical protein